MTTTIEALEGTRAELSRAKVEIKDMLDVPPNAPVAGHDSNRDDINNGYTGELSSGFLSWLRRKFWSSSHESDGAHLQTTEETKTPCFSLSPQSKSASKHANEEAKSVPPLMFFNPLATEEKRSSTEEAGGSNNHVKKDKTKFSGDLESLQMSILMHDLPLEERCVGVPSMSTASGTAAAPTMVTKKRMIITTPTTATLSGQLQGTAAMHAYNLSVLGPLLGLPGSSGPGLTSNVVFRNLGNGAFQIVSQLAPAPVPPAAPPPVAQATVVQKQVDAELQEPSVSRLTDASSDATTGIFVQNLTTAKAMEARDNTVQETAPKETAPELTAPEEIVTETSDLDVYDAGKFATRTTETEFKDNTVAETADVERTLKGPVTVKTADMGLTVKETDPKEIFSSGYVETVIYKTANTELVDVVEAAFLDEAITAAEPAPTTNPIAVTEPSQGTVPPTLQRLHASKLVTTADVAITPTTISEPSTSVIAPTTKSEPIADHLDCFEPATKPLPTVATAVTAVIGTDSRTLCDSHPQPVTDHLDTSPKFNALPDSELTPITGDFDDTKSTVVTELVNATECIASILPDTASGALKEPVIATEPAMVSPDHEAVDATEPLPATMPGSTTKLTGITEPVSCPEIVHVSKTVEQHITKPVVVEPVSNVDPANASSHETEAVVNPVIALAAVSQQTGQSSHHVALIHKEILGGLESAPAIQPQSDLPKDGYELKDQSRDQIQDQSNDQSQNQLQDQSQDQSQNQSQDQPFQVAIDHLQQPEHLESLGGHLSCESSEIPSRRISTSASEVSEMSSAAFCLAEEQSVGAFSITDEKSSHDLRLGPTQVLERLCSTNRADTIPFGTDFSRMDDESDLQLNLDMSGGPRQLSLHHMSSGLTPPRSSYKDPNSCSMISPSSSSNKMDLSMSGLKGYWLDVSEAERKNGSTVTPVAKGSQQLRDGVNNKGHLVDASPSPSQSMDFWLDVDEAAEGLKGREIPTNEATHSKRPQQPSSDVAFSSVPDHNQAVPPVNDGGHSKASRNLSQSLSKAASFLKSGESSLTTVVDPVVNDATKGIDESSGKTLGPKSAKPQGQLKPLSENTEILHENVASRGLSLEGRASGKRRPVPPASQGIWVKEDGHSWAQVEGNSKSVGPVKASKKKKGTKRK